MRFGLLLALSGAALLGQSTEEFTVETRAAARGMGNNRGGGECEIRVRIDQRANVELRGVRLRVNTLQGAPSFNDGSWCSDGLPANPRNFQFQGVSGRGQMNLTQRPGGFNGGTARVSINDSRGGADTYVFRLSWDGGNGGGGGNWDNIGPGGGNGGNWGGGNNSWSSTGRGDLNVPVDIRSADLRMRNGRAELRLDTNSGPVTFQGDGDIRGNSATIDIRDCSGMGLNNCNGRASLVLSGNEIRSATATGNSRNGRFSFNFSR